MELSTQFAEPASPSTAAPYSGMVEKRSSTSEIVAALRLVRQLDGLTDEEYAWLAEHGVEYVTGSGTRIFRDGDPATHMVVILDGEIQVRRQGVGTGNLFIGRSGQLTGLLPFSRMKTHGGDGYATEDVWALAFPTTLFPEILARVPSMAQRSVSALIDRVREMTRLEQQTEKLNAVGKLAANLGHELNNPASAAQRAAANLLEELRVYGRVKFELGKLRLSPEQEQRCIAWSQRLREIIGDRRATAAPHPARSNRENAGRVAPDHLAEDALEERLMKWLRQQKVTEAWAVAAALAEARVEPGDLDELREFLNPEALNITLTHLAASLRAERMAGTVLESTARIFDLIRAIQQYSFMDMAPMQDVDVAQSLENTLAMLQFRLANVQVERDFDPDLPKIMAYGSELNQVWMALIENALDAIADRGTIRLRTHQSGDLVLVEVWDDGGGISPELHSRIFEPFFTTKSLGKGLGLGLDSVNRIVTRHHGFIRVESKPGATCFQVRLPLLQAGAY